MKKFKESYKDLKQLMKIQKMSRSVPEFNDKSNKVLWGTKKEEQ